uniref:M96 mating-specific protein family n=1 Tax=Globisporangium ultimum (strain ATCC 200006 / CBS 805.95 / DAOM BR144) TaxID=431595 RepID=K3W9G2_GLOUD
MDEFELLPDNMAALLDGYEALPELYGAGGGPVDCTDRASQASVEVATPEGHRIAAHAAPAPLLRKRSQDELQGGHEQMIALHETQQLLDLLEVAPYAVDTSHVPVASCTATVASPQSGSIVVSGGEKRCKSKNLSRERLKHELMYLRQKVRELEDELRVLRPTSSLAGTPTSLVAVDRKKAILPVWQRIAERQLDSRQKAEAENARLKDLLEGQIKLAKGLEQMLRKRPNVALMSGDARKGKKARVETDDDTIYEMLTSGLEPAYKRMDDVFRANGLFDTVDESIRHARVKTKQDSFGNEILYLELADVYVIPFDLHMTGHAAWRSVTLQFLKENHAAYERLNQPEHTIAVKFREKSHRNGTDMLVDKKVVMRRYIEKERMALVWRTLSEGEHQLSGMHTDETGWCVLQKIPASSGSSTPIGTVMKSCVHVIPEASGSSSPSTEGQPEIGMLTNFVIDSYEEDVIAINKMMENLLLEEALAINGRLKSTGMV